MTSSTVSPDDECGVCGTTRENHGDKHHEFDIDGNLRPKKKAEPARQQAPQTAAGQALARDASTQVVLRLVERLVAKQLLSGDDLLYIFGGGDNASNRGSAEAGSSEPGR